MRKRKIEAEGHEDQMDVNITDIEISTPNRVARVTSTSGDSIPSIVAQMKPVPMELMAPMLYII